MKITSKLILITGAPAVGKFTVAKELQKSTGYKLLHNHMVIDFALNFFERGTLERVILQEKLYSDLVEYLMKTKQQVIMTYAYATDYVARSGTADTDFVKKIQKIVQKYKGDFLPVQLIADKKVIVQRVQGHSRKKFSKIKDITRMKKMLDEEDFVTPLEFKNALILDTTTLTAAKAAKNIQQHFKL